MIGHPNTAGLNPRLINGLSHLKVADSSLLGTPSALWARNAQPAWGLPCLFSSRMKLTGRAGTSHDGHGGFFGVPVIGGCSPSTRTSA